ncbi:hypothetical protein PsorP6_004505 [Peronosclerospora sorghi]|uniref:Uncharacterized protein n=1 Tax=Peronosclerospora sorghi TaxID=230839 RepID=A0ACC0VM97_9STRA|nr:hypothetical protein PsorP6_004505 [Peronosclerospora sorghi]
MLHLNRSSLILYVVAVVDYLLRSRLMAEEVEVGCCYVAETGREVQSKLSAASCKVCLAAGNTEGMGLEEMDMKAGCAHYRSMQCWTEKLVEACSSWFHILVVA